MDLSVRSKKNHLKLPQINSKNRALSNKTITSTAKEYLFPRIKIPQIPKFDNIRVKSIKALEILHSIRIQAREKVHQKLSNIQKRMSLITGLQDKYKIKFTQSELRLLNNESLEVKAKIKHRNKLKLKAYHKISNWWKKIIIARKFQDQMILVQSSANIIQRWWKSVLFRCKTKLEIMNWTRAKTKSAIKIQANFRGFLVRKTIGIQLKMKKISRNYLFFYSMKQEIMTQALKNILDIWNIYKIKEKYMKLYDKIKEKERKNIFSILKVKSTNRDTIMKIQKIIKENLVPNNNKKSVNSEPCSPILIKLRDRSDTEDFQLFN